MGKAVFRYTFPTGPFRIIAAVGRIFGRGPSRSGGNTG